MRRTTSTKKMWVLWRKQDLEQKRKAMESQANGNPIWPLNGDIWDDYHTNIAFDKNNDV